MSNTINNEIQIFNNVNFGQVRSMMIDGEPWFVGRDVAEALGYENVRNTIPKYVEEEDKLCTQIRYAGQNRKVTIINESGLYSLIMSSKLPKAKEFKRWVTSEVLPTIRKTGSYGKLKELSAPPTLDSLFNIDTLYLIVSKLKEEHDGLVSEIAAKDVTIAEQNITIKNLEAQAKSTLLLPETLEVATDDDRLYTVTDIATEFGITARLLNQLLLEWKLQRRVGSHYEMCEGFDESKYVHYKFYRGDKTQMKWTGSGRLLIHNRLKQHGYSLDQINF